jgi:glycosyltransferase involved in cell wall biosynthesis
MNPFFTIVVPTYNAASHISICLDSIVNQSLSDFEVLVQDGLSTDETVNIVKDYSDRFSFISLQSDNDQGVYDAMNRAIVKASGKYLLFLGSDDRLFDNNVLSNIHKEIANFDFPDFVYGNVLWGNDNYVYSGEFDLCKLYDRNICHQSVFYHRKIFTLIGTFDLSYPVFADWILNFQCFSNKAVRILYANIIVSVFALGGLSTKQSDLLSENKKLIFPKIARTAEKTDFYKLKVYLADVSSFTGIIEYLYFKALYFFSWLIKKIFP